MRATFTFVEELVDARRTGRAVSAAAIKGFLASWILPRTVIVLGSLLATAVLLVQTWILYNQTQLLRTQSIAAQIEQEYKLRDRALLADRLRAVWKQLHFGIAISPPLDYCEDGCQGTPITAVTTMTHEERQRVLAYFVVQNDLTRDSVSTALEHSDLWPEGKLSVPRLLTLTAQACIDDVDLMLKSTGEFLEHDQVLAGLVRLATTQQANQLYFAMLDRPNPPLTVGDLIGHSLSSKRQLSERAKKFEEACASSRMETMRIMEQRQQGRHW